MIYEIRDDPDDLPMALLHKRVRDSCGESSVVAGLHEQPYTSNLQD